MFYTKHLVFIRVSAFVRLPARNGPELLDTVTCVGICWPVLFTLLEEPVQVGGRVGEGRGRDEKCEQQQKYAKLTD